MRSFICLFRGIQNVSGDSPVRGRPFKKMHFVGVTCEKPVIPVIPVMARPKKACEYRQKPHFGPLHHNRSSCHKPVITCHEILGAVTWKISVQVF